MESKSPPCKRLFLESDFFCPLRLTHLRCARSLCQGMFDESTLLSLPLTMETPPSELTVSADTK